MRNIPLKKVLIAVGILATLSLNVYFVMSMLMSKMKTQVIIDTRNRIMSDIVSQLQLAGEVKINVTQLDGSIDQLILILKPKLLVPTEEQLEE